MTARLIITTIATIATIACFLGCGRIGYSPGDEAGGSPGDAGSSAIEPADGSSSPDASCSEVEPFALTPVAIDIAAEDVAAFNSDCGSSCSLQGPVGLTYPSCIDVRLQLAEVVNKAIFHAQIQNQASFEDGQIIAPEDAADLRPLSPSSTADRILAATSEAARSEAKEAWRFQAEVPCQNCTAFETAMVLWYPDTRWVAVLSGTHGGG